MVKEMKKIFMLTIVLIMLTAFTAGCGNQGGLENGLSLEEQAKPSEIADAVLKDIEFPSAVIKNKDDLKNYIDFNTENVYDMVYYICGSGAYPDELLILKFNDTASVSSSEAKNAVQKRLDSQIETYKDYAPAEMYKLDNAKIITRENWLFFFALADNDKAMEILNSYFK